MRVRSTCSSSLQQSEGKYRRQHEVGIREVREREPRWPSWLGHPFAFKNATLRGANAYEAGVALDKGNARVLQVVAINACAATGPPWSATVEAGFGVRVRL